MSCGSYKPIRFSYTANLRPQNVKRGLKAGHLGWETVGLLGEDLDNLGGWIGSCLELRLAGSWILCWGWAGIHIICEVICEVTLSSWICVSCCCCRVIQNENDPGSVCVSSSHGDVGASLVNGSTIASKTTDIHRICGEEKISSCPSTYLH